MEAQQHPQPLISQDEVSASATPNVVSGETTPNVMNYSTLSPCELVDHLAVLMQAEELPQRKQVDIIRSVFYKKKEQALSDEANSEQGAQLELQESRMNDLLQSFKEQDRERTEQYERLLEENKIKSETLLKRLEELLNGEDDFGKIYSEFHQIREEWEAARPLSSQAESTLRKSFVALRERFYDLKAINEELREYDFRKNLEAKTALLAEIEPLVEHPDPIHAIKALKPLIDRWHDLGPVAREVRAEIHGKFKELTTTINKKHQDFHDQKHQREAGNLEAKSTLCAEIEHILAGNLPTKAKAWDELIAKVQEVQARWKTIGFAGRKDNDAIYQRFRAGLDVIYARKSAFFEALRAEQNDNLKKKKALIARAAELRESSDWDKTAEALKALQEEWTKVGAISPKYSLRLWEEFRSHFDHFYSRLKEHRNVQHGDMNAHLKDKLALLDELEALRSGEIDTNSLRQKLDEAGQKWKAIGHVPYKNRDEVNARYKAILDDLYTRVRSQRFQRRLDGYSASISDKNADALGQEKQRMSRLLERMRSELQTYENNLNFLNISSKGGSSLLKDIERKKEKLVADIALLEEKIKRLNQADKA